MRSETVRNSSQSHRQNVEKEKMSTSSRQIKADAHLIFMTGEAFLNAARTLDKERKSGNPYILDLTLAVNSAMALELFLKCLRTIEKGFFFMGHEFDQQFSELKEATRNEVRRRHDKAVDRDQDQFFSKMRANNFKTDLDSLLDMGKNTFSDFRYAFEPSTKAKKTTWGLDNFMFDIRDIILERHPEWTPHGYPPPR